MDNRVTKVFKWSESFKNSEEFNTLTEDLRRGKTVVLPTETVYGLGANGLIEDAIDAIYEAKGRPSDNPLILHIHSIEQLDELVIDISDDARDLMNHFWPGPLTLIFKKSEKVPSKVTGGLDTVAIRMPNHPVALEIIKHANVPVAAPSANISGRPSPTNAKRVIEDLEGRVDYIVDDGDCLVGLESTIVDVSGDQPIILRPGQITKRMIEELVGECLMDKGIMTTLEKTEVARAPGMKYKHYAPNAEVYAFDGSADALLSYGKSLSDKGKKVGVMGCLGEIASQNNMMVIWSSDVEAYGRDLFESLRKFDELGCDVIIAQTVEKRDFGIAIMNRLLKAADGKIIGK